MGTEKREVEGGGEMRKKGEGRDGYSSWGPEELVKEWVPQVGEDNGRVTGHP